jgi:type II secretory pathway pseudopilin PulG
MKKNAFTLIETIGVIIVIALVATITIPIIINSNDRDRVAEQEKADIKAALDYYFNAHPDIKAELRENGEVTISAKTLVSEGYIREITKYNNIKVTYNEDGTYDVSAG